MPTSSIRLQNSPDHVPIRRPEHTLPLNQPNRWIFSISKLESAVIYIFIHHMMQIFSFCRFHKNMYQPRLFDRKTNRQNEIFHESQISKNKISCSCFARSYTIGFHSFLSEMAVSYQISCYKMSPNRGQIACSPAHTLKRENVGWRTG